MHLQYKRPGFNPRVRKIPWRRKWQSTPVFLLGKSRGHRSLAGYSPWGYKELDMTERPTLSLLHNILFIYFWLCWVFVCVWGLVSCDCISVSGNLTLRCLLCCYQWRNKLFIIWRSPHMGQAGKFSLSPCWERMGFKGSQTWLVG